MHRHVVKRRAEIVLLVALLGLSTGCSLLRPRGPDISPGGAQIGDASWYGKAHHHKRTANGERFDESAMTAAHPTFPFGTRLRVTNLVNNRSVIVRVNDRGPFVDGRIIDLSLAAARALGIAEEGVARVRVEPLRWTLVR